MSYKDIMMDGWYRYHENCGIVVESAAIPCMACNNCEPAALANGCTADKCIICGCEADHSAVAHMSPHSRYTCTGCGAHLLICETDRPESQIITGYYITSPETKEDII